LQSASRRWIGQSNNHQNNEWVTSLHVWRKSLLGCGL
jgi:hypothetical protein